MYLFTSILCGISTGGLEVKNEKAFNTVVIVTNLLFTPINALVILSFLGNVFGKLKDKDLEMSKASKFFMILAVIIILIVIFETRYMGEFIRGLHV